MKDCISSMDCAWYHLLLDEEERITAIPEKELNYLILGKEEIEVEDR